MASYFELPAQDKAPTAATIEAMPEASRKQLGGMSLLSPAVTQLLDDLGEEQSDSDSNKEGSSEGDDRDDRDRHNSKHVANELRPETSRTTSKSGKGTKSPRKDNHSPNSKSGRGSGGLLKPKQPHMARFHSLRSMLFTSAVENKMKEISQEETQKQEAADKWRNQHEQRQMSRPKTPEKDSQSKDKLGSRIKTTLRRITSKDPPTLDTLNEDGAAHDFSEHGSTASSDADDDEENYRRYRDDDEESINHSDVEDLVRWVSRRDPPSDGEARADRKAGTIQPEPEDSGHESLGNSDVEDLVRWVSRRSEAPERNQLQPTGYSDASTESDSENGQGCESSDDEEDADDLVRWISHREGPTAGPMRKFKPKPAATSETDDQTNYHSDVPELGRWVTRHDGTSGESVASSAVHETEDGPEVERGRPRSRDRPSSRNAKNHLTEDDIGDLVRWVSRHDSKGEESALIDPLEPDEDLKALQRKEEAKQHAIGMSVDEGSLSHSDVKDLIEHVQSTNISAPPTDPSLPKIEVSTVPVRPGEGESGALRRENTFERDARKPKAQEHLQRSRAGSQQIDEQDLTISKNDQDILNSAGHMGIGSTRGRERDGSLGQEDVDELVRWISEKH